VQYIVEYLPGTCYCARAAITSELLLQYLLFYYARALYLELMIELHHAEVRGFLVFRMLENKKKTPQADKRRTLLRMLYIVDY
jgi:hypothetical protein